MKKAVILAAQNFQDEEFVYPYYRLMEEGFSVEVATPDGKDMFGKYGVPARATMDLNDLNSVMDADVVILPGGFESPDRLRLRQDVLDYVRQMYQNNKLIAAICHGPWICISSGIMKGKRATGFMSIKDDIINSGALYSDADVVVDKNLITSPHYKNNGDFMKAIFDYFDKNNV
jgi:protease I